MWNCNRKTSDKKYIFRFINVWTGTFWVSMFFLLISLLHCSGLQESLGNLVNALGKDKNNIFAFMREKADFLGSAVWTMTSILASFVTFYYGLSQTKNFGVTNRKVISYSYGRAYLPMLIFANSCIVAGMTFAYYLNMYGFFYILAVYSCYLQALLIVVCVYATSLQKCRKTIVRIMRNLFENLYKRVISTSQYSVFEDFEVIYQIDYYMECITKSEASNDDKAMIIKEIFNQAGKIESLNLNEHQQTYVKKRAEYLYFYSLIKKIAQYVSENP